MSAEEPEDRPGAATPHESGTGAEASGSGASFKGSRSADQQDQAGDDMATSGKSEATEKPRAKRSHRTNRAGDSETSPKAARTPRPRRTASSAAKAASASAPPDLPDDELPDEDEPNPVTAVRRGKKRELPYELDLADSGDRRAAARRGTKPADSPESPEVDEDEEVEEAKSDEPRREPNPAWVILAQGWAEEAARQSEPTKPKLTPPPTLGSYPTYQQAEEPEFESEYEYEPEEEPEPTPPPQPQVAPPTTSQSRIDPLLAALNIPIVEIEPPDRSAQRKRALIVTAIVVCILIVLFVGIEIGHSQGSKSPTTTTTLFSPPSSSLTPTSTSNTPTSSNTTASSTPVGATVAVELTGSGPRQSALFNLPAHPVNVMYSITGGTLNVKLLNQQSTGGGDTFQCSDSCNRSSTVTKDAGTYYLDVNSSGGNWDVSISY